MERQRIGELLLERGLVSPSDVEFALESAKSTGGRVASQLLALGLVDEGDVIEALATLVGFPGVDLSRSALALEPLSLIPREIAELEQILPLELDGDGLLLAVADPHNARVLDEVQLISGRKVLPYVALSVRLSEVIRAAYDAQAKGRARWVGEALPKGHLEPVLALREGAPRAADVVGDIEIHVAEDDLDEEEVALATVSARPGPRLVFVVDDEEEILTLLSRALTKKGYRVEVARRGKEALDRVGQLYPDLILLDANLPELHGFDLCKKIKGNPRFARIPVIIMTAVYRGWRFAHDSREAFGVDDYVEKPFRLDDFLRRIDHHLARSIGEPARNTEAAEKHFSEGSTLLEGGCIPEAVEALARAAEEDPFSAKVQYQLGRALQAAGEPYRAISAYERSVDLRPDLFPALRSLAALYQQKGFRRKAIEAWERAIGAAPDDATREKIKTSLLSLL